MYAPSKAVIRHLNITISNIEKQFEDPEKLHPQTIKDFHQIKDFCAAVLKLFRKMEKQS